MFNYERLFLGGHIALAKRGQFIWYLHKEEIIAHGTYIIIALSKDGIMVSSDSRLSFFANPDTGRFFLGYIDSLPKTFIVGKNTISHSGNELIYNVFFSTIINDYKRTINEDTLNIRNLLPSFFSFIRSKYNLNFANMLFSGIFFTAGFDSLKPRVFCYQKIFGIHEMDPFRQTFIESAKSNFSNFYSSEYSCIQNGEIAEKIINDYATANNKTDVIGGPIELFKITAEKAVFLKNNISSFKWQYLNELIFDFKHQKTKIYFPSAKNEEKFRMIFHIL